MKAIVCSSYGPPEVLRMERMPKPLPKDDEILIKVKATSVHRGDSRMRGLDIPGPWITKVLARLYLGSTRPRKKVLGMELSGVIESTGEKVTRFQAGDEVMATTVFNGFGGYAEYKTMPQNGPVTKKPKKLSFEEAAVLPSGGVTALGILKQAYLKKGQEILIYGASGSLGSISIQLAKAEGAIVTAVCSGKNMEMVRSLGADHVIDYQKEDFTTNPKRYDVVFDAVGKIPKNRAKKALKEGGIHLNSDTSSNKIKKYNIGPLLDELAGIVSSGGIRPFVDRTYNLEQIVEAHRYVDQGHKRGNVAVTIVEHGRNKNG